MKHTNHFARNIKRGAALLLAAAFALSATGCGSLFGQKPVTAVRTAPPPAAQAANAGVTLALRQYVFARLKTEQAAEAAMQYLPQEAAALADEAALAWQHAIAMTDASLLMAEQAAALLPCTLPAQTADDTTTAQPAVFHAPIAASPTMLDTGGAKDFDYQAWAENLTKQYDAIKGNQTIRQLAQQLGTDARTAFDQLTLAQEILHDEAMLDAAHWDKVLKIYQGVKTTCKVGLFVTATIASGGGTVAALQTSSMSLGAAGATIVGGTDCIVDIAATGSTIILGEKDQVTVAFNDIKDKLAPVSAVVGLIGFNGGETGEQLAYLGDSLTDWFFDGKIMGVKVSVTDEGGFSVNGQAIDTAGLGEAGLQQALNAAGLALPGTPPSLTELMGDYTMDPSVALQVLGILAEQLGNPPAETPTPEATTTPVPVPAPTAEPAPQPAPEPSPQTEVLPEGSVPGNVSGLYRCTITGPEEPLMVNLTIIDNGDGTLTLVDEGDDEPEDTVLPYRADTGEAVYNDDFYLKFYLLDGTIYANGFLNLDGSIYDFSLVRIG